MPEIETRGGKRPGSGAKKKDPQQIRVRTTIQIPKWMITAIDKLADLEGKTRSSFVVDIIKKHIDKLDFF